MLELGEKPVVIYGDENSLIKDRDIFGAWNAIVVTNENDKQQLVKQFSQNGIVAKRILTIQEIKGLEFNEVLVWNFFSVFDSWSSRNNQNIKELLAFKYNCLYVCITRAKSKLYFYESKNSDFWKNPQIEPFIEEGNHSSLDSFFSINQSSEDWLKSAKEFELQGAYEQAKENYQRIGLINDVLRMDALLQEKHENWEQAGDIWDSLSQWDKAILSWFKAQPDLYRKKWQQLNQAGLQQRANYLKKIFEDNENFELAEVVGDICTSANNYPQAKSYYELAELWYTENNQLLQTAQVLIKLKQWTKAAKLWEELQAWQKAAEAWEKVDEFEKAASAYTKQKNWEQAAKLYAKAQCWQQAETSWKQVNNWKRAALVCEKQGKLEEANKLYQKAKCWLQAARLYQRAQLWEQAASLYEQEKCWHQAQKC